MGKMNTNIVQEKTKKLPLGPGVYLFRNNKGSIIYVGKAVNLKNRVSSYFVKDHDSKTKDLVSKIADMEWIDAGSEIEALILESELIKRYKPKFNILLKDDKSYCYVKITKGDYPVISIVRQVIEDKSEYLGPFIDAGAVRTSLRYLRKIFPYCTCSLSGQNICLYYHLGLCRGHGETYISPKEYQANIRGLISFLSGKKEDVVHDLTRKMKRYSKEKAYEKAAEVRDRLSALTRMRFEHVIEEKRELRLDKALLGLKESLGLDVIPKRIECYDISNIFGRAAVGSMVVFENGIPTKNDYRRFEIKTVKRIDDFAMHSEVAKRRFTKIINTRDSSFSKIPDLVIIDGGKGQLSSVLKVVSPLGLPTRFVGLTKKLEEMVILGKDGKFSVVNLLPDSEAYFLVQRVRDEAHRFAITYHRNLRSRELTSSRLDNIPGIGPKTKKKLILHFGSLEKIKEAQNTELASLVGTKLTDKIREVL
jgi:excinuclease ABC subunit C